MESRPAGRAGRAAHTCTHLVQTWNEQVHNLSWALLAVPVVFFLLASSTMKIAVVLLGLCAAVAMVMLVHAVHQEVALRSLRGRMADNTAKAKTKEGSIATLKETVTMLRSKLQSSKSKVKELETKKGEMEKSKTAFEADLKKCTDEKARPNYF